MKGQKDYFMRILNTVEKNKEGPRHYFENRTVKFTEWKVVETKAARDLMWLNENNTSNFINDTLEDLMNACDSQIPCKELYQEFMNYCDANPDGRKRQQYKYFIDSIANNTRYKRVVTNTNEHLYKVFKIKQYDTVMKAATITPYSEGKKRQYYREYMKSYNTFMICDVCDKEIKKFKSTNTGKH